VSPTAEVAQLRCNLAQLEAEAEITRRLASYDDGGPEPARKYQLFRHRNNWYLTTTPELLALVARRIEEAFEKDEEER